MAENPEFWLQWHQEVKELSRKMEGVAAAAKRAVRKR